MYYESFPKWLMSLSGTEQTWCEERTGTQTQKARDKTLQNQYASTVIDILCDLFGETVWFVELGGY